MKTIYLLLTLLTFASLSEAGFRGYQSTTDRGLFNSIKCSTGLSCTKVGDKFNMVSSPSLVGPLTLESGAILSNPTSYDVSVASSGDSSVTVKGGEGYAAILRLWADEGDDSADKFSIVSSGDNTLKIKSNTTVIANITSSAISGDGTIVMGGFKRPRVLIAASASADVTQCGSVFYNSGAAQVDLPEASTVLGCSYTFATANASNFDANPADGTDYIQGLTNAAGDMIRNATVGNSVTLTAISNDLWVATAIYGTWSDAN